jgi:3-oxoacyl-[acyl-carrier-protein] synthase III
MFRQVIEDSMRPGKVTKETAVMISDTYLGAIGVYLPEQVMSAEEAVAANLYSADDLADSGMTGVLVDGSKPPQDMAVIAGRKALSRSGADPTDLDLMIHSCCVDQGPELSSTSGYILREIGADNIPSLEVRQGCNGILAAMEIAVGALANGDRQRGTALLTTAENAGSPLLNRWRSGHPAFILSDGASAVVLTRRPGFARLLSLNSTTLSELEGMHRGAEPLHPPGAALARPVDMGERAAHFGQHVMALADLRELIGKWTAELARQSAADAGVELSDIVKVCHPNGARWLVELWMSALGLPFSRSMWDYGHSLGHLGATDQLAAIEHLVRTRQLSRGDRVLLIGNAPGWSIASSVIEITEVPQW